MTSASLCRECGRDVLTFTPHFHKGQRNRAVAGIDSAAVSFSDSIFVKDLSHEAHLSTKQLGSRPSSRFPVAYVDRRWPQHFERASRPRSQEAVGLISGESRRVMRGYSIIKKRSDFVAANRGKRYATPGFVLLVFDRRDDDPAIRLGITITKKVGNAVVRNRMRRRFRELAREMLADLGKAGADHVLIGRDGGIEREYAQLRADIQKALVKLGA